MPEELVVVMDKQGQRYELPRRQLAQAIAQGYIPAAGNAPLPKVDVQPSRGDTASLAREAILGAASTSLPAGEQFKAPSVQEIIGTFRDPVKTGEAVGGEVRETLASILPVASEAINNPYVFGSKVAGAVGDELSTAKSLQGTSEGDEYRANITGKLAGVAGQVFGAKKLPQMKMSSPKLFPSIGRAVENFEDVMSVAKRVPIDTTDLSAAASHARTLARSGGQEPKVIRDFIRRLNDPNLPPMTYEEARNFYSNATRLSADESKRLTPVMKREVIEFTQKLRAATEKAADSVGKMDEFNEAMEEYARASGRKRTQKEIKKLAMRMLKAGAIGGATVGGGVAAYEALRK